MTVGRWVWRGANNPASGSYPGDLTAQRGSFLVVDREKAVSDSIQRAGFGAKRVFILPIHSKLTEWSVAEHFLCEYCIFVRIPYNANGSK